MIEIRTLRVDDYEAICEVWQASGIHYQVTGRESREAFTQQMSTGLQTVLGAFSTDPAADTSGDNHLAGVVVLTHDGRKGWINRLGVRPEYQRLGIGTTLVHAAEDFFHDKGLTIIAALVENGNEASLGMFQKAGYAINESYYLSKRDHPNA